MGKRFYIGTVREIEGDERTKKAMSKQTSLFTELREFNWEIRTSKLRIRRKEELSIDDRVEDWQKFKNLVSKKLDLRN